MDSLFSNTGGKIKTVAKIVFILGIIGSIALGIFFGVESDWEFEGSWLALTIIIAGPIVYYISALLIYGFGCIVDATENIRNIDYNVFAIASNEAENAADTGKAEEENQGL